MLIKNAFKNFLQIRPEDEVPASVKQNFKHNFLFNTMDNGIFLFGDSFVSASTILPVFVSTLTDSPLVIGLIPALLNAGWFLPQLFISGLVKKDRKLMPFARRMAVFERIPLTFFPILVLMLSFISPSLAVLIFVLLLAWRGFASGFVALPWQEVIARVIPLSHRARFFGVSRMVGQALAVLGSIIAAFLFRSFQYPYNYAISFTIAIVTMWMSYFFFSRTIEPEIPEEEQSVGVELLKKVKGVDIKAYAAILKKDRNFVNYLVGRCAFYIGTVASSFMAVYAIKHFSLTDDQAAIFTMLIFASGVLGTIVWGSIGDRIGPKKVVVLASIFWALSVIVAIFAKSPWVFYAVFIFWGFGSSGSILGDLTLVMEIGDDDNRPTYLGLARTIPGIFLLISPLMAGWLIKANGYQLMFIISLVFLLISIVFLLRVKDRKRRKPLKENLI